MVITASSVCGKKNTAASEQKTFAKKNWNKEEKCMNDMYEDPRTHTFALVIIKTWSV